MATPSKNLSWVGFEGDKLRLGYTEGGGAPMLLIEDEFTRKFTSFVFDSPQQVSDVIKALEPYGAKKSG